MSSSRIKLIIEKGPREGETLEYNSASVIKIGRVIRGNTIAIKDAGISSKHISIQFDNQLLKWTLIDLDSSNGTILNELNVEPHVSSCLNDGDCIKIGELTCFIVKIESEFSELGLGFGEGKVVEEVPQKRNLRSRGRKVAAAVEEKRNLRARGTEIAAVENEKEKEVVQKRNLRGRKIAAVENEKEKEVVKKPNLRGKGKKGADVKIELESLSCKRVLRSSKKGENMNVDAVEDSDLDGDKLVENGVPVQGKRTGRGRKKMVVVESLVDNNDAKESIGVDEGNEDEFDKSKADLAEKLVLRQEGCEGKEVMVDGSLIKGPSKIADLDRQDGCQGLENDSGPDKSRWVDLEKMTLGDFFDYMEVKLPKEIHDKIEKINSDLKENARKCHEFRLQINETRNSNIAAD